MLVRERLNRIEVNDADAQTNPQVANTKGTADALAWVLSAIGSIDPKAPPPKYKAVLVKKPEDADGSPGSPAGPNDAPGQTPDNPG